MPLAGDCLAEKQSGLWQLAAGVTLALVVAFGVGCYGFAPPPKPCQMCSFIFNYQTLIAGALALIAASIAAMPVFKQVRIAQTQSALLTREVIINRLTHVEARRRDMALIVSAISQRISVEIHPDPEGSEIMINPEWAFSAAQRVSGAVTKFEAVQDSRSDPAHINRVRQNLILVARQLGQCLDTISIPGQRPWEHDDSPYTDEQIRVEEAKAAKLAEVAEGQLTSKVSAVEKVGKELDAEYVILINALRTKLRKIDDSIVDSEN